MRRLIIILLVLLQGTFVFAQKESANWYFGENAGLSFNSGAPVPLVDGKLNTSEGCATISDTSGNLLFYTDGVTVWDRKHNVMPNGEGLLGHSSSTESALIIPKPGSKSRYYIFTIDMPSYFLKEGKPINGVNFSEVDLSLNGGFGDVVEDVKNIHLITYDTSDPEENEFKSSEKIAAVTHSNGSSIWVTTSFMNRFYSFLVDNTGVNTTATVSQVQQTVRPVLNDDDANVTAIGYLKISPNGKRIAIAHSSTAAGSPRNGTKKSGKVLLYDFNNTTGQVSNQITLLDNAYPYGVEFSPDSKLLYITNSIFDESDVFINGELLQYNVESANIAGSKQLINSSQNVAGALQLAIDGRIYRAGYKVFADGFDLSVINNPNNIGPACDYSENSINLGGKAAKLGLPPFVQSIFIYNFDYEFTCFGEQTHFFITTEEPYDSVQWDFGDGNTSTDEDAYHTFAQSGTYTVGLSLTLNGITRDSILKEIIISEPPNVRSDTYELIQCDSFDTDSTDGRALFNLQQANESLSLDDSDAIQVYFYNSLLEAENDTLNINALDNVYRNQVVGEIVYAKVYRTNTECFAMTTVQLSTTSPLNVGEHEMVTCNVERNEDVVFDLAAKAEEIADELGLSTSVDITFYETEYDAAIGINALPGSYISKNSRLFIRAETDNTCYGNGVLNLELKEFVELEDQTLKVCKEDFPMVISSGIAASDIENYNYEWNTSEVDSEISITKSGIYEVLVSDRYSSCSDFVTITIEESVAPVIADLIINEQQVVVMVDESNEQEFQYALDDEFGLYQESNIFIDVTEGVHEVYVKDSLGCEIVSKDFNILYFPKFFTPNNDNVNDIWNVHGLDSNLVDNNDLVLSIYNRYGKLLYSFNPLKSSGWNGTYNDARLTSDDYWYFMKLPTGEVSQGHFTLKR
ncbi:T9SS type B sorting domain-containing protein [Aurantibacter sp.]|uniref:T9SS type B sorting domain-containing protein n=1 Tax=Aurantibacter sp. TaxID=2807103 RepID=UPI003266E464